jgi:prevent-host-death family protein
MCSMLSTNQKGAIAEAEITAAAVRLGIPVLRPIQEHGRYDLAFELGDRILRVQCKWASLVREAGVVKMLLYSARHSAAEGYIRTSYREDEVDLLAGYCAELDRCYLLPIAMVAGRKAIYLRVSPPQNGQRACINLEKDFRLAGAVAQWNERSAGSRKVVGSNPTSSTLALGDAPGVVRTGSNEFRDRFGYYLERAAGGAEIHISRHGKPFARLMPAAQAQAEVTVSASTSGLPP